SAALQGERTSYLWRRRAHKRPPMGAGSRRYAAVMAPIIGLAPEREAEAEGALGTLTEAALEPIVDMVLLARDGHYEARTHEGSVRFRRRVGGSSDGAYEVVEVVGRDPFADQSTDKFTPLAVKQQHRHPTRGDNAYP